MGELTDLIGGIARDAAGRALTPEAAGAFRDVAARLDGPVRLAVAGKVKAGKSTLLNALIGEELAPTDAGECTRILTWYRYADRPYALLYPREGAPVERPYTRREGALHVDLGEWEADRVAHLEIGWPTSRLADLVLLDTPGIASLSRDVSARTHEALTARGDHAPTADAVLYLLRHTHATDLRFLEAFHEDEVARGTPVNTVGVLSRADEIGSSRLDAMEVAARVARRYEHDPQLHRVCPVVVPVDGLLGHAAVTLRESEFTALRSLAQTPEPDLEELLLTADRLATMDSPAQVPAATRTALLDRLGLFGVRLAMDLLRRERVATSSDLAAELAATSGLDRLKEVVMFQFEARGRILKARSAVTALQGMLAQGDARDGAELLGRLEQVTSSAHDLEEVRILLDLRSGELSLDEARTAELDRLMGGSGHDWRARLGQPGDCTDEQLRSAALEALRRWQAFERHPLASRAAQLAARAAVRTLEGYLADRVR